MYDICIIGCGITGSAVACELSRYKLSMLILEKENDVAMGATRANSAIIHAGYDPLPGTHMAKFNAEGSRLTEKICHALDVEYRKCGSLVVAFSENDRPMLEELLRRGRANGVEHLSILESEELHRMEPRLSDKAVAALWAPDAAIVNPWDLSLAMAETAIRNNADLKLESEVRTIKKIDGGYAVGTDSGRYEARYVINAAGCDADLIHDMVAPHSFNITPVRGEYYLLDKSEGHTVEHIVFQCPNAAGKGVLIAPTVHGNLIVGPNAEATARYDKATTSAGLAAVGASARRRVPDGNLRASIRNFAGLRARADCDDFIVAEADGAPGFIDLAGIASPGLSSAPAIAREACTILKEAGLLLEEKEDFIFERHCIRFNELSNAEKSELVARDSAYGNVICRCETVTEGEMLAAMRTPIPPRSIDGMKRRVNSGMGRCQGGFCSPQGLQILAKSRSVAPYDIEQDAAGGYVLMREGGKNND
jgi:glycerol-3-phosphate dehydrogenase